jgi:pyruvate,water dikinase
MSARVTIPRPAGAVAPGPRGPVLGLDDPTAVEPSITGAKAANLARAATAGMTVVPGFVVTTVASRRLDDPAIATALRAAWDALTSNGRHALVVRSSSTAEDAVTSSMAGQFTSVVGVSGWDAFLDAVERVVGSATVVRVDGDARAMAVLVQRALDATVSGVMFGVDPVVGNRHHVVVEAVRGNPEQLVSGRAVAAHFVLSRRGRLLESVPAAGVHLTRRQRHALVRLARRAGRVFGGAQDVEWAIDADGRLWLLQTRPVTAIAERAATNTVFGPGPVAETFPRPLGPLEADCWVPPLADGIARALAVTGAVPPRRVRRSPIVTTIGGWAACDLELLGVAPRRRSSTRVLNPLPGARHLAAAWRVGRLRAALPALASDVVATVDDHLGALEALGSTATGDLVALVEQARRELATVHCLEVLAGMLRVDDDGHDVRASAPAIALHELVRGRAAGLTDDEIVERAPVVLALVPPSLAPVTLPVAPRTVPGASSTLAHLGAREALRLRARWLQELVARVVAELGARAVASGTVASTEVVTTMTVDELARAATDGVIPPDLATRTFTPGPPLPTSFRLSTSGQVIALRPGHHRADGLPASDGRAVGTVRHRVVPGAEPDDVVLVVRDLDPALAASLPSVRAVVAEHGSALSHLAILAREFGVPTVVGVADARRRFPPGARVLVDGSTGDVVRVSDDSGGSP